MINLKARENLGQPVMLVFALLFLGGMIGLSRSHTGQQIVSTTPVQARVTAVTLNTRYGQRAFDVVFSLPGDTQCTLTLREPVPQRGATVPLLQHTHRNDSHSCDFERQAWQQEQARQARQERRDAD